MARGRTPTPTNLKLLRGNPGKRPINQTEPKPPKVMPKCPKWLSDDAKKEWRRVAKVLFECGLLTEADQTALAAYCESYALWKQAQELIKTEGITYEYTNKSGATNIVKHPAVEISLKSMLVIKQFCSEFGLTPSSRGRINLPAKQDEEDPFEEFLRRATTKKSHQ